MTKLYVCEISNLIKEVKADSNALENYFDKLGKQRIEHILKNNKAEDRARALGASYLLLFALEKAGYPIERLPDFSYKENGKPYLREYPDVYFNISHTKNIITCVISDGEVGVDIEHARKVSESAINRVFSENEKKLAGFSVDGYIRLWTMKEACAKLSGTGLPAILDGMEIVEKENGKYVKKLKQDIRKTSCCKVIAEGKLLDDNNCSYYYSVCVNEECKTTMDCSKVSVNKYTWSNGKFIEYI